MKVVVLVQEYPSAERPAATAFAHSRNLWYASQGVDVSVASFACTQPYAFEDVPVFPVDSELLGAADVIVSHAPNLRNHVRVLWRLDVPAVFFFHGFEALRTRRYYPAPYAFQRHWSQPLRGVATDVYDVGKLRVLGHFLRRKRRDGSCFVFVSEWMRQQFLRCVPGGDVAIAGRDHVIPNAVHDSLATARYQLPRRPDADFVTFRPDIDQPKYAIDLVVRMAAAHPRFSFDVYGRGDLVRRLGAPANLRHHDVVVRQAELVERGGRYRAALIPSRLDAQGVTACEMATFGIPTIVSDLPVARDVLGTFSNVGFIGDDTTGLAALAESLWSQPVPALRRDFLPSTTCAEELEVLRRTLELSTTRRRHVVG